MPASTVPCAKDATSAPADSKQALKIEKYTADIKMYRSMLAAAAVVLFPMLVTHPVTVQICSFAFGVDILGHDNSVGAGYDDLYNVQNDHIQIDYRTEDEIQTKLDQIAAEYEAERIVLQNKLDALRCPDGTCDVDNVRTENIAAKNFTDKNVTNSFKSGTEALGNWGREQKGEQSKDNMEIGGWIDFGTKRLPYVPIGQRVANMKTLVKISDVPKFVIAVNRESVRSARTAKRLKEFGTAFDRKVSISHNGKMKNVFRECFKIFIHRHQFRFKFYIKFKISLLDKFVFKLGSRFNNTCRVQAVNGDPDVCPMHDAWKNSAKTAGC